MPSIKRVSVVRTFEVDSILFSAVAQVGDNVCVRPASQVLAVYREIPTFSGKEGDRADYAVYRKPIVQPIITEQLDMRVSNLTPIITVNGLWVKGISTAAVVQIGSSRHIQAENRTKHIRQLFARPQGAKLPAEIGVPPNAPFGVPGQGE